MRAFRFLGQSLVLVAFTVVSAPTLAAESYDNCTGFIDSIPATINTQGTWCLRKDLATGITQGTAITVATNNVTIDCNDFKLGGLAGGLGTGARGIQAGHQSNITVRHCSVRGFFYGLNLSGSGGGHIVEDNKFDGNTYRAISVSGDGSVVRRNQVRDTGGSSITSDADGIVVSEAIDVLDNTVSGVMPAPHDDEASVVRGIYVFGSASGSISGNRVSGVFQAGPGTVQGIGSWASGRIALTGNHVTGDASVGSVGVMCSDNNGRAMDNVINGFSSGIVGCRDDGNSL